MTSYLSIITAAAKAAKVSAVLLYSICAHESRDFTLDFALYDNGSPSYGICQLKEGTAKMLGWKGKDPMELRNPYTNVKYAALYLKYQQDRYGSEDWCILASAYNAGSFIESSKKPTFPRNLKYVNLVKEKLDKSIQHRLNCGKDRKLIYYADILEE
jgi:soluble lytic murein transglycosylase-like protein